MKGQFLTDIGSGVYGYRVRYWAVKVDPIKPTLGPPGTKRVESEV